MFLIVLKIKRFCYSDSNSGTLGGQDKHPHKVSLLRFSACNRNGNNQTVILVTAWGKNRDLDCITNQLENFMMTVTT